MAIQRSKKFYAFVVFIFLLLLGPYLLVNPIFWYKKIPNTMLVNKDNLFTDVQVLSSIDPPRSYLHLESLNKAADYITSEFKKTGCELEIQKYLHDEKEYKNIICSFGVQNPERLIVGAHYDVDDVDGDGMAPGADDNASGIAGILELARMFGREQPELPYRVDFVAYTLEEEPFFGENTMGSAKHARYLKDNNVKVLGMIAVEMIGFFSSEKDSQKYPLSLLKIFYPDRGNFIAVVGGLGQPSIVRKVKRSIVENSNINAWSINGPEHGMDLDLSDHLFYWAQGYDAVMVTDTSYYRNPNYHLKGDTIEKLDFDKMSEVVKGLYFVAISF